MPRYERPSWFGLYVQDPAARFFMRLGIRVWGARILRVRGRKSGGGELVLGGKVQPFKAVEIPDDEKVPMLRDYLRRWKFEVGVFFGGVSAESSDEELRRIAPDHPVFLVAPSQSSP